MGSAASAREDVTVAVASPALREEDETKPMRFRGAKQDFYEQTMRIFSKNDMNNRHPGYAPDCSHLADVQVDHQLRKKIELSVAILPGSSCSKKPATRTARCAWRRCRPSRRPRIASGEARAHPSAPTCAGTAAQARCRQRVEEVGVVPACLPACPGLVRSEVDPGDGTAAPEVNN
mmetsp:Transcript_11885/g.20337  ORF Transcript_11885/g.20337 Transcript_11885/m.20337 type:complete len:176 (-) Transcript_11885:145-672(-)